MVSIRTQNMSLLRIENYNIRIAPHCDCSFLRKEPEHFGRGSRCQLHKAIYVYAPLIYSTIKEQRQSQFHTGCTIRYFGKIVFSGLL